MKTNKHYSALAFFSLAMLATPQVFANQSAVASGIKKALSDSTVKLNFRARYEAVDQKGIDKRASALTLKSRISLTTGAYKGFSVATEVDNVTDIIDSYNSTSNGKSNYPVVADPTGTDVNLFYVKYKTDQVTATGGRQRILHNNQRFVGGVAWRQNEQTYDGYRLQYQANKAISVDYSYVYNVNRLFGPRGAKADLHGQLHLLNSTFKVNNDHKFNAYAYLLDFDSAAALSTDTYGVSYNGKFDAIMLNAAYAKQSDAGNNHANFSADYYNIELGTKLHSVTLLAGVEVLGSDNGIGFSTPLATLHKFQGFADKFLGTPAQGVEDLYVTAKTNIKGVKLSATYHTLSSDVDHIDYGSEIDIAGAYPVHKNTKLIVKLANYNAKEFGRGTTKLWLQVAASF